VGFPLDCIIKVEKRKQKTNCEPTPE